MSVTAPVSLFTIMRETSTVSGRSAARTASADTAPSGPGSSRVTEYPRLSSSSRVFSTASCSTAELITCPPFGEAAHAPDSSAQLSLSEPQEVKTTSPGAQPSAEATFFRAASSSFFASRPFACVELGLP